MSTTEVYTYGSGILYDEALAQKGPAFLQVLSRPRQLEIVYIDDKIQAETFVKVARWPLFRNGFKPDGFHVFIAVPLPKGATVGVTVQCLAELHHRLAELRP